MPSLAPAHITPTPARDAPRPDLWDLVDQARDGDDAAFGELHNATVGTVYPLVLRRVRGDRESAEEILAEVYLSAWRALGRVQRTASSPAAWLVTIAQRRVIDHHRGLRCRPSVPVGAVEDLMEYRPTSIVGGSEMSTQSAETLCIERLDRVGARAVWEYARHLTPEQYEVLVLRFRRGLSIAATAAEIGKRPSMVKMLQARAIARLRELLDGTALDPRHSTTQAASAA